MRSTYTSAESDLRFVYSACCICYLLNDFTHINKSKMIEYIMSCQSVLGPFSLTPMGEIHGK